MVLRSLAKQREGFENGTRSRRPKHPRTRRLRSARRSAGKRRKGIATRAHLTRNEGWDFAERLSFLIVVHWTKTLRGPFDWAEHPLAYYTFSDAFLAAAKPLAADSLDLLAWICTMVASGLGMDCPELELKPGRRQLREMSPASDSGARSATSWRCLLRPLGPDALVIDYRVLADGQIRFEQLSADSETQAGASVRASD